MSVSEEELDYRVAFLKVLADKSRLRILGLLSEREYTVKELAEALQLKEPTISHHLSALRRAEVVAMRQAGTTHHYRLRQEEIHALLRDLKQSKIEVMEVPEELESDEFERNVLTRFFVNGGLTEIPTQRKKQLVVLKRLALEFEPGERYTELQVNEILKRLHPDFATLRRYLVDNRLLERENSIYWRAETRS
jgi:hypothetical protein